MMVLIFACMLATLVFGWREKEKTSLYLFFVTLCLVIGLFLWEIYSPKYGFSMPWITL